MALKKKPVTGMKDILPKEMEIRDYVIGLIKETYGTFGFSSIETPCVEHIESLCSKQGGENEKLIFKILKRGEKLKLDTAECEADLVDSGLRYDLTVPLSRYYANHANELSAPIELILATTTLLGKLDFTNFTIRINNRKILKAMAAYCGFPEAEYDSVFIILDKMDKIGMDGVTAELLEAGYDRKSVDMCKELFETVTNDIAGVNYLKEKLGDCLEAGTAEDLETIISTVEETKSADFKIAFDPTLVRGMSYYTGPIFEISMDEFGGSVGGGGRYDEMIGKFTGNDTCACGFSIGFERIVMLLLERDFKVPSSSKKKAYLIDKKATPELMKKVISQANEERKNGYKISINVMKKNKKFQKELLAKDGYEEIREFFAD